MAKAVTMYCVKCRKKVSVKDPDTTTTRGGRSRVRMSAYRGVCPVCGTKVFRFIGKAPENVF